MNPDLITGPSFVFLACHPSVTQWCRKEISALRPGWLPAFSRPGFLTYKVLDRLAGRFELPGTFVRTFGHSLTQIRSTVDRELISGIQQAIDLIAPSQVVNHIHLWNRQWIMPVSQLTDVAELPEHESAFQSAAKVLRKAFPDLTRDPLSASPDSCVLDVVQIDQGHWALGYHFAGSIAQRWPGGIPEIIAPEEIISRAYLKTTEALQWSAIPIVAGDTCIEVGSAPGGSCLKLLELGARVIAIDPADMHPSVANHKDLTHVKKRARDVPDRVLSAGRWLFVDANIMPSSTLEMSEAILCNKSSHYQGAILTLKTLDDDLFDNISAHIQRVQSWGFRFVKTRHLAFGRQEICLTALTAKGLAAPEIAVIFALQPLLFLSLLPRNLTAYCRFLPQSK